MFERNKRLVDWMLMLVVALAGCVTPAVPTPAPMQTEAAPTPDQPTPTALPTRPPYPPGTLVEYTAQTGDTLIALAARFNTTVTEIREANPIIPDHVTTLPPGLPMQIPIYYQILWGSPYQILPDSQYGYGPAHVGFDAAAFVAAQPGWLKDYSIFIGGATRRGGAIVEHIATNFSINPKLLLAILEYQTGALSQPEPPVDLEDYPLGYVEYMHTGLASQLTWAANYLNNGFYAWRNGNLTLFEFPDGRLERPDPWQNAATVALHFYFARVLSSDNYAIAISSEGLEKTYRTLFGDGWVNDPAPIPGSLEQPALRLPFKLGQTWAYTGGPHTGWGEGEPFAAIDFAPSLVVGGCTVSPMDQPVVAVADGVIARTGDAIVVLDLDGDGLEQTGWVIFYLHLENDFLPKVGTAVKAGDPIGYASCDGGQATGTHVHIARKYNGEWIPAAGEPALNMENWIAREGSAPYLGTLTRQGRVVQASDKSNLQSAIKSEAP